MVEPEIEREYDKIDIASGMLDRALVLFLDQNDLFSSLHLAGAADEIFGRVLEISGHKNALRQRIEDTRAFIRYLFGHESTDRNTANVINRGKNHIKHLINFNDIRVTMNIREDAKDMLERAIENHDALGMNTTQNIERFYEWLKQKH